jgi:hypothetical protein
MSRRPEPKFLLIDAVDDIDEDEGMTRQEIIEMLREELRIERLQDKLRAEGKTVTGRAETKPEPEIQNIKPRSRR